MQQSQHPHIGCSCCQLLQTSGSAKYTANDSAEFFQSKVRHIRDSTATYPPPDIQPHPCPPLTSFDPVTGLEVQRILATCPTTSSALDPIPLWFHWLPIHAQVLHKLCILMYDVHSGRSPTYIKDIVTACFSASQRPGLRSASTTDYIKPRLSTKFGERAFSQSGPQAWNDLPDELRSVTNAATFKKHLKTHFF